MKIYSLFLILALFSCSAKYHYQKALKKGLEPLISSDTIRIATIDSVPVIKHDTIVYEHFYTSKDTVVMYENVYVPKTRLETRIEYKLKRDTIRMITRVEVQKAKAEGQAKKNVNMWVWIILFMVLGLFMWLASRLANKLL